MFGALSWIQNNILPLGPFGGKKGQMAIFDRNRPETSKTAVNTTLIDAYNYLGHTEITLSDGTGRNLEPGTLYFGPRNGQYKMAHTNIPIPLGTY